MDEAQITHTATISSSQPCILSVQGAAVLEGMVDSLQQSLSAARQQRNDHRLHSDDLQQQVDTLQLQLGTAQSLAQQAEEAVYVRFCQYETLCLLRHFCMSGVEHAAKLGTAHVLTQQAEEAVYVHLCQNQTLCLL